MILPTNKYFSPRVRITMWEQHVGFDYLVAPAKTDILGLLIGL